MVSRSHVLVAGTRATVAAATVLAVAAAVVGLRYGHGPLAVTFAVLVLAFLSVPVVGAAAARAAPGNPVGWILLASGVFLPVATGAYLYAQAAFAPGSRLPGAGLAGWLDGWPWVPAVAVVPTVGLLLFPTGRPPSPRWRPVLWAGYVVLAALTASTLFGPGLLDFPDRRSATSWPARSTGWCTGTATTRTARLPASDAGWPTPPLPTTCSQPSRAACGTRCGCRTSSSRSVRR